MAGSRLMGLGLIQVIQDRFVETSVAYSGRLGSGTRPAATEKMELQEHSSAAAAAEYRESIKHLCRWKAAGALT